MTQINSANALYNHLVCRLSEIKLKLGIKLTRLATCADFDAGTEMPWRAKTRDAMVSGLGIGQRNPCLVRLTTLGDHLRQKV